MKGQFFVFVVILVLCAGIALGALGTGEARRTQPSVETVDSIARQEAAARLAREAKDAEQRIFVGYALLAMAALVVLTASGSAGAVMVVRVASQWHHRQDRQPDALGRFPLMMASEAADMFNPNTGLLFGAPVSESVMLELARIRGAVDMTAAAYANGIEARQSRERQRDVTQHGYTITDPNADAARAMLDVVDAQVLGAPRQHYITDASGETKTISDDIAPHARVFAAEQPAASVAASAAPQAPRARIIGA